MIHTYTLSAISLYNLEFSSNFLVLYLSFSAAGYVTLSLKLYSPNREVQRWTRLTVNSNSPLLWVQTGRNALTKGFLSMETS